MSKLVYDQITCAEKRSEVARRLFDIFSSDNIARNLRGKLTALGDQGEPIEAGEPEDGPLSNPFSFIPLMGLPVSTVQFATRQDPLYSYIILLHWYHHNRKNCTLSTDESIMCLRQDSERVSSIIDYDAMTYNQIRTYIPVACASPVEVEMASARFNRFYELSRLSSFHSFVLEGRHKSAYE